MCLRGLGSLSHFISAGPEASAVYHFQGRGTGWTQNERDGDWQQRSNRTGTELSSVWGNRNGSGNRSAKSSAKSWIGRFVLDKAETMPYINRNGGRKVEGVLPFSVSEIKVRSMALKHLASNASGLESSKSLTALLQLGVRRCPNAKMLVAPWLSTG